MSVGRLPVTLREARPHDALAMGRIKRDSWGAAYRGQVPDAVLDRMDADLIAGQFAADIEAAAVERPPTREFLVAEGSDGRVSGYVALGPYRWDDLVGAGEIYAIYVAPACWGSGTGGRLLRAAAERLLARGHCEAALWVLEGNHNARAFYEAMGWQADGVTGDHCEVGGAKEIRYRRGLG